MNADKQFMVRRTFRVIDGGKGTQQPQGRGPAGFAAARFDHPLPRLDPRTLDPLTAVAFFDHMAKTWRPAKTTPALRIVRD